MLQKKKTTMLLMDVGIVLMVAQTILSASSLMLMPSIIDGLLVALFLFCLLPSILNSKFKLSEFFISAVLAMLALWSCVIAQDYAILITVITILALRNRNLRTVLILIRNTQGMLIVLHVIVSTLFWCVGEGSDFLFYLSGVYRWSFGFSHPNVFSMFLFNMVLIEVWINWEKMNFKSMFCLSSVTALFLCFSKTRTTTLLLLIFFMLVYFCKANKMSKTICLAARFVAPFLFGSIYLCMRLYTSQYKWIFTLNDLLSGRIKLAAYAYEKVGITLLGQNLSSLRTSVEWDTTWQLYGHTFDNMYAQIICNSGIVWAVILIVAVYSVSKKSNNQKALTFLIVWALYGVTEVQVLNVFRLFPLLLLSDLLGHKNTNDAIGDVYSRRSAKC